MFGVGIYTTVTCSSVAMILPKMTDHPLPEKLVEPPPYSLMAPPTRPGSSRERLTEIVKPTPTMSQIHLHSKNEDIEGTFCIDPSIPVIGENPKIKYGKARKGKSKKVGLPHASFQTRGGNMKLQLDSISGAKGERANVLVGSRSGKIEITLLPRVNKSPGRMTTERSCMGLEVFSRSGDVIVFVPATYSGVMRVESVKGGIRFLPCFASHMRVLKETDREKMVTFGEDLRDELCEVSTRSGQIVVGLAGRDEYKKAGLWQRLFE